MMISTDLTLFMDGRECNDEKGRKGRINRKECFFSWSINKGNFGSHEKEIHRYQKDESLCAQAYSCSSSFPGPFGGAFRGSFLTSFCHSYAMVNIASSTWSTLLDTATERVPYKSAFVKQAIAQPKFQATSSRSPVAQLTHQLLPPNFMNRFTSLEAIIHLSGSAFNLLFLLFIALDPSLLIATAWVILTPFRASLILPQQQQQPLVWPPPKLNLYYGSTQRTFTRGQANLKLPPS